MKLPAIQPLLGSTLAALKVEAPDRQIVDNLAAAVKSNVEVASLTASEATAALQSNVSTAITGMGNMVRKLPTGEQIVESRDGFITRIKTARSNLLLEV
jgi:hypothetical protein